MFRDFKKLLCEAQGYLKWILGLGVAMLVCQLVQTEISQIFNSVNYLVDCHEILYIHGPDRVNPAYPLTFPAPL